MKHFITLSLLSIFLLAGTHAFAQQQAEKKSLVLDGAFRRDIISEKEPIPYPKIREADVVWSKKIWRVIDLREKIEAEFDKYNPVIEDFQRTGSRTRRLVGMSYFEAVIRP